jgi:hypothetical protein
VSQVPRRRAASFDGRPEPSALMGLGMIIPGQRAEARVQALLREGAAGEG